MYACARLLPGVPLRRPSISGADNDSTSRTRRAASTRPVSPGRADCARGAVAASTSRTAHQDARDAGSGGRMSMRPIVRGELEADGEGNGPAEVDRPVPDRGRRRYWLHLSPVGRTDVTRKAWSWLRPEADAPAGLPAAPGVVVVDDGLPAPPATDPVTSTFCPTYCCRFWLSPPVSR